MGTRSYCYSMKYVAMGLETYEMLVYNELEVWCIVLKLSGI